MHLFSSSSSACIPPSLHLSVHHSLWHLGHARRRGRERLRQARPLSSPRNINSVSFEPQRRALATNLLDLMMSVPPPCPPPFPPPPPPPRPLFWGALYMISPSSSGLHSDKSPQHQRERERQCWIVWAMWLMRHFISSLSIGRLVCHSASSPFKWNEKMWLL